MSALSLLLPALLSGAGAALLLPPTARSLVRRRLGTRLRGLPAPRSRSWKPSAGLVLRSGGALAAFASVLLLFSGRVHLLILAAVGVFIGWAVVTLRSRSRTTRERHRSEVETTALCDAMVAELTAGIPPPIALEHAADDWPLLAPAAMTSRLGGDVSLALREASRRPGAGALAQVGAAWEVSMRSGASLAGVLDRLAITLRDDQEASREIKASLGAPRATARLLAVLPLVAPALGTGMGSSPWTVVTSTMLGAVCLAIGSVLAVAGVFWVERIADRAEVDQ